MARVEHPCKDHLHAGCEANHSYGYREDRACRCSNKCCIKYKHLIPDYRSIYTALNNERDKKAFFEAHIVARDSFYSNSECTEILGKWFTFRLIELPDMPEVCRQGFGFIFGIMLEKIRAEIQKREGMYVMYIPEDKVATSSGNAVDLIRNYACKTIEMGKRKVKVIDSIADARKLYKVFLQKFDPEGYKDYENGTALEKIISDSRLTFKQFRKVIQEQFNYALAPPNPDFCRTCQDLRRIFNSCSDQETLNTFREKKSYHMSVVKSFAFQLKAHCVFAKENINVETICFDFDDDLPAPMIPGFEDVYFESPFWEYSIGLYSAKLEQSFMFMWPENLAKKGLNEYLTCLNYYIRKLMSKNVENLFIFSFESNQIAKSITVMKYLYTLVRENYLKQIIHFFPADGHPYPYDQRIFANTKFLRWKHDVVERPVDWEYRVENKDCRVIRLMRVVTVKDFERFYKSMYTSDEYDLIQYHIFEYSESNGSHVVVGKREKNCELSSIEMEEFHTKFLTSYPYFSEYQDELIIDEIKINLCRKILRFVKRRDSKKYYSKLIADHRKSKKPPVLQPQNNLMSEKLQRLIDDQYDLEVERSNEVEDKTLVSD